ncbi:aminopeptidase N [Ponticaulis profundi]|uniref:Aminopeptidase N n=1 Tax=Ponticaulis profundi TaxID=2665222 RepID=A0ABW1S9G7_9PROT
MRTDTPQPVLLKDYEPYPFAIPSVSMTFQLDPKETRVVTKMKVERTGAAHENMVLNGEAFERVGAMLVNGKQVDDDDMLKDDTTLTLMNLPHEFELETEIWISPEKNTELSGLYMSGGRFCTQCESEGFRRITYWPDRPDVMSVFSVRLEADVKLAPTLLSNGNPGIAGAISEERHFAEWHDPHPKPSYLFALCGGDYDVFADQFTTMSGNEVQLSIFVDKGDAERAAYAMDSLKRAMKWDEDVFGREYDLDVFNIVAVRDFNFGAMENKGLNIFNSAYVLADADTATDGDFEAIESIVGHEYFHNWTGNRITCRDWFQLCLKEGLTVFRDQEFSADMRSRPVQRIKDVIRLRGRQFAEDAGPLAHPVRPDRYGSIDNLYTATVYEKGAELIRALKTYIGEDAFKEGMDLYFDKYDGTATTIEAFYEGFEKAVGFDLSRFRTWYAQAGTPVVTIERVTSQDSNEAWLKLTQKIDPTPGQTEKKPVPIPLRLTAFTEDGTQINPETGEPCADHDSDVVLLMDQETDLALAPNAQNALVSANRNFSAPVKIQQDLTDAERLKLVTTETDSFAKWEALQTLSRAALLDMAKQIASGATPNVPTALVKAQAEATLATAGEDPAFAAQLLTLPGVGELFMEMTPADPAAIYEAKRLVRAALQAELKDAIFASLDAAKADTGEFSPDAASAGRRSLNAAYIDLLSATGTDHAERIYQAFDDAKNMTDTMAALRALSYCGGTYYDQAVSAFEAKWKSSPLVMDKWFSVQSTRPDHDAIERVKTLLEHEDFDWKNPNRVRSVAGAFAMGNHVAFHDASGDGYALLGDVIRKVDPLNGALSARLLTSFEQWRRVDEKRQALAKQVLTELQNAKLSKNAMDIVSRALAS